MNDDQPSTPQVVLDNSGCVCADVPCAACGQNLRGCSVGENCPQCGKRLAEAISEHLPQLDHQGRVNADMACVACGYNLRTQPIEGLCPECANPVVRSAYGHYLYCAGPDWVKKLAAGALALVIACFCALALLATLFLWPLLEPNFAPGLVLTFPILIALFWLLARGAWLLTARDPSAQFIAEGLTTRRLARYLLIAMLIALYGLSVVFLLPELQPQRRIFFPYPALAAGLFLAWLISLYALPLALLRHIIALMRRVPRPGLVRYAKIEFWLLLICPAVLAAAFFVFVVSDPFVFATYPNTPSSPSAGPNNVTSAGAAITTTSQPGAGGQKNPNGQAASGFDAATTAASALPSNLRLAAIELVWLVVPLIMLLSGCATLAAGLAGIILLISVQRALAHAARAAEAHAVPT